MDNQNGAAVDNSAFFKIGYGLYLITSSDGQRDNGMIGNAVMQLTATPARLAVAVNQANYTCELIKKTRKLNVNVIDESSPFAVFENFGFKSGRDCDKFVDFKFRRSANGLAVPLEHCNAFLSMEVEEIIDYGTHTLFIGGVSEAQCISPLRTMTYNFYQDNVKPRPDASKVEKGFICTVCGYIYEGETLPPDFICPLCKHPASDFIPVAEANAAAAKKSAPKGDGTYSCNVCGYTYNPALGDPDGGIEPGTKFEDIPDSWVCPICGMTKADFRAN